MKTFMFTGRKYNESKSEPIEEKKFDPMKFESISHAETWFLVNYPDYYFGGNIKQVGGKQDFTCIPVPDYYKEFYGTDNMAYIVVKELEYLKSLIK